MASLHFFFQLNFRDATPVFPKSYDLGRL